MEDRPRIEPVPSETRRARTSVTHERIRQLAGDADEPHPHDRAARLPLAKAWLPLHNYFRW
jgi:hypothetical protein